MDPYQRIQLVNKYYLTDMKDPLKHDGTSVNDNVLLPLSESIINKSVGHMMGVDENGNIEGWQFSVPSASNGPATRIINVANSFLRPSTKTRDA